eukprot:976293-Heterocapsa_arctica.AAC.1
MEATESSLVEANCNSTMSIRPGLCVVKRPLVCDVAIALRAFKLTLLSKILAMYTSRLEREDSGGDHLQARDGIGQVPPATPLGRGLLHLGGAVTGALDPING